MQKKFTLFFVILLSIGFLTGCWDRQELNDIALIIGSAVDQAEDGAILGTVQIVVPSLSGGGTMGKTTPPSFFIATSSGKDFSEVIQKTQKNVSRRLFRGHRQVLFIGEKYAKNGVSDILDSITRDPESRLRTDVIIVKGSDAKNILSAQYPFEPVSSIAALKQHLALGIEGSATLRNFLIAASTDGSSPTLSAMELNANSSPDKGQIQLAGSQFKKNGFQMAGTAVFNKQLKLVGYVDNGESGLLNWITQYQKRITISTTEPTFGRFGFVATNTGSKISAEIHRTRIKFYVTLTGEGVINENNTKLDLMETKNLRKLEQTLNDETKKRTLQMIKKVQKKYGTDILGFGEVVHRQFPYQWKAMKKNWEHEFAKAEVEVNVILKVKRVGLTGPSLQLRKGEILK
ncbi:Ger(x)C family spore germination protein [Brevibacillus sp. NRS-1366]|uniref:Ger(x)C family spore germination protein n=1 Tax=Brevibacillus sp. NRS-1366 TaxID=3233899 RepID=UPI003D23ACC3